MAAHSLSGKPISFWIDSTPQTFFPALTEKDISVDVAIVGGGIVGLTAAKLLKRSGKTVAVIESRQLAAGVSGHTTAKVTSLHQLIYADLIQKFGEEKARIYGESNQTALEFIASLVEEEKIDCDFSRRSAYTFTESEENLDEIKAEVEAAVKLGLPATFVGKTVGKPVGETSVQETLLPFPIAGAVKFDNQAQFHVRKYLLHLANRIPGSGSYVFEDTRVQNVEAGTPCQIVTDKGTIAAKDVIVSTHLPILDHGLFFAKSYPKRSYIVGAKIEPSQAPEGMFIGSGGDYYSIRTTPYQEGLLLLIGGCGHKTGSISNTEARYQKLEDYGRSRFGIDTFDYRWSTQDMVSFDKLPFIGKLTPFNSHIYVATGFSLWGMTKGTMAGMLLSDLILGINNPAADLYDATRATPFVTPESMKQNIDVGMHWVGDRLKGLQTHSFAEVDKGEGKIITVNGEKVAAHRDQEGNIHAVSAVCTHLACIVNWNNAEKSWDCPCHGARFSCDGKVLQGPAIADLEKSL